MANMRLAMDSTFWDLNVSSPQTLDGVARAVPDEHIPLDASRASRVIRPQQVSIMSCALPRGLVPTYSPTPHKELGSFCLQSMLLQPATSNWWLGLIGQFRPSKVLSSIKADFAAANAAVKAAKAAAKAATEDAANGAANGATKGATKKFRLSALKRLPKHFLDKSLYSLGLFTQFSLGPETSLLLSREGHGERKGRRSKALLFHKLARHDITLEAAWPELFIDRDGRYWDVPQSLSLDMSSLISDSGLRYRFGVHKNGGHPEAVNATNGDPPMALMPGLCAKASFSYEKSRDIWRRKERVGDSIVMIGKDKYYRPTYDVRLNEPHAAISGIIGGTCTAWFKGKESSMAVSSAAAAGEGETVASNSNQRHPFTADLFGSVCCSLQHGSFRKMYGDLSRVDARLNICSASAFTGGVAHLISNGFRSYRTETEANRLASPRLNVILQQQVRGPFVFRVDSEFSLGSTSEKSGPHLEDVIYSLSCSIRDLQSGKVVAWYSPKRKEGMVEFRLFEF